MKKNIVERTRDRLLRRSGEHVQISKNTGISYSFIKKIVQLSQKDYSALNIEKINIYLDKLDWQDRLNAAHLKDGMVSEDWAIVD